MRFIIFEQIVNIAILHNSLDIVSLLFLRDCVLYRYKH